MKVKNSLAEKIKSIESLLKSLESLSTTKDKVAFLSKHDEVSEYLHKNSLLKTELQKLNIEEQFVLKSLLALGQGQAIFSGYDTLKDPLIALYDFLKTLIHVEKFYDFMGGVIGYHLTILKVLNENNELASTDQKKHHPLYLQPPFQDFSQIDSVVKNSIRTGIERFTEMAEIYTVGGAGDRLNLIDENTGMHLPVAALIFSGRTLLDGLVRDLQAREYLYYKLTGNQRFVPLALMTNEEKRNHYFIYKMCQEKDWYNRGKENFKFFTQPLVPVLTSEGDWAVESPVRLLLRPGGHGALWKLALDNGVFDWFQAKNARKCLIRQINNPIAGSDYCILSFIGFGLNNEKTFGFASCPRLLKTAEGMDVLCESKKAKKLEYSITNVEYTEFKKNGIQDLPIEEGSSYSAFPANTNILFFDVEKIVKYIHKNPLPGLLLNMKNETQIKTADGSVKDVKVGRLESTMQNIADSITFESDHPLKDGHLKKLETYITYNQRNKTISVCKKTYTEGSSAIETSENCFYDVQQNYHDLLAKECKMHLPHRIGIETYLKEGPSVFVDMHPAIGPLYNIISQKIKGGSLGKKSELYLEIAEAELLNVNLEGSLRVIAKALAGNLNQDDILEYSEETGKCILNNVTIKNLGIDWSLDYQYSKGIFERLESLSIVLHGNGEFYAEDVTFTGNHHIEVPNGNRVIATMQDGEVVYQHELITEPTWYWKYSFDSNDNIVLKKYAVPSV